IPAGVGGPHPVGVCGAGTQAGVLVTRGADPGGRDLRPADPIRGALDLVAGLAGNVVPGQVDLTGGGRGGRQPARGRGGEGGTGLAAVGGTAAPVAGAHAVVVRGPRGQADVLVAGDAGRRAGDLGPVDA